MPSLKNKVGKRFSQQQPPVSLDDVCNLLTLKTERDELGQAIKKHVPFMVFCSRLDVTRAEQSSAGLLGMKPEFMLVVDSDSYDYEKALEYQNKRYAIYKSFERFDGFTELYCELKTGDK